MSYQKASTWLFTLMGIIGEETTNEVFREYYRRWAFKHPTGTDFIEVVNDIVRKNYGDKFGPDMNWFFDQVLYGTGICDYKVNGFRNTKVSDSESSDDKPQYKAVVQVERVGEVMLPVDILVHFVNGEEILETWDGKSRYKDYTYEGHGKVLWVKIDPQYKLRMDVNFINNSVTADPDRIPVRNLMNKILISIEFYLSLFTL
jgi:hypothetical protein